METEFPIYYKHVTSGLMVLQFLQLLLYRLSIVSQNWGLYFPGMLRGVGWQFVTYISE